MKAITTKSGEKAVVISIQKTVEVIPTEKHPAFAKEGKKPRKVPEHMVKHLLSKGMIEDPAKAKK